MVSPAVGRSQLAQKARLETQRSPVEGWGTVVLHACLLIFMAESIARADPDERVSMLIPLALGGGAIGFVLAKARTFDLLAHVTALVIGITAALLATSYHYGDFTGGWRATFANIETRSERLVETFSQSSQLDDDLLIATIGITLWLIAYCSAWMLFRRRWLGPAVMLPGVVILTSLGLDRDASANPVYAYLAVAMVLSARHFAFRRQLDWQRMRLSPPPALPGRFLRSGVIVALAAVTIGITLPVDAPAEVRDEVSQRATQGFESLQKQWQRLPFTKGDGEGAGNYTEFPEEFTIGSEINLTDEPVAILQARESEYLAARRYNVYDGHRWLSDVDATFRFPSDDEDLSVTPATFVPSQAVPLSPGFRRDRIENTGVISVFRQQGTMLFTIDSYVSSSEATTVIMGWRKLDDEVIPVNMVDANTPPDLYALLTLLQRAEFRPSPNGGEPTATNAALAADIDAARQTLRNDYPVQTRVELVAGDAVLHVTGRLPIYDDIEVVYSSNQDQSSSQYQVSGLESEATPDDLRQASTEYPQYVRDRYLQLPASVTDRTRDLASQVAREADATTPFDQAMALQVHLRATYPYLLDSPPPPEDRDFVDDFLFVTRTGRCEHYATAMVVMLRTLGIPSRLVSGYSPGDVDPSYGGFLYLGTQAHTWIEAYFPGYGWIPFEPTPSEGELDYGTKSEAPVLTPTPTPTPTPTVETELTPTPEPEAVASPSPIAAPISGDSGQDPFYQRLLDRLPVLPTVLAIGLLGIGLCLALAWMWGLRGLRPGAALYARALRIARFWGVRPDPTLTPTEFASEVERAVPGTRGAMRAVAEMYSEEQYGPARMVTTRSGAERTAWRAMRGSLLRWRPWRKRSMSVRDHQEAAGD